MRTKISEVRAAVAASDWRKALAIAARFPQLGDHRKPIVTAHECLAHPGFYRQLGKDEAALVEAGKAAMRERYGL